MGSNIQDLSFSSPTEVHEFAGLLFDMDGTIIDSTAAVVRHWTQIGEEIGVDPQVILATSHGRRSIDILRLLDPQKATWEYVSEIEGIIPRTYGSGAQEIPGARDLLASLEAASVPWAIVTSGTRPLVTGWLDVMKLAHPKHLVTAEDVENGKPDPACYRLGRERLQLRSDQPVLVLEDAPAGIHAGKDAGCKVVGLATSHSIEQLVKTGADWIIKDMSSIRFLGVNEGTGLLRIEISNSLLR